MNLVTWLARAARADPGRVALYSGSRPWISYGDLAVRVATLAGGLASRLGLKPGDRVAIAMKNSPEYLLAMYAAWWAGLVVVPVNAKLHRKELDFIVADSGARFVIESPADLAAAAGTHAAPIVPCAPTDLAWLFYTSGTTGRPKGAMLSHRNLA
jgi:long-chain acyl-CoA synthetase